MIKYGGNAMTDAATRRATATALRRAGGGGPPVVVHGGGPYIRAALDAAGLEHTFVRGLRVTTEESLPVIERVLTLLGKELAQEIGPAVGLTGRDGGLLRARLREPELGLVGRVTTVNTELLEALQRAGFVPVVACLALAEGGAEEGRVLNVNADEVAGAVAGALGLGVVFLTDTPGVLDDPADPGTLLPELSRPEVEARVGDERISGGMVPKVEAALAALDQGAPFALIADGRHPSGVQGALAGGGTRIRAD